MRSLLPVLLAGVALGADRTAVRAGIDWGHPLSRGLLWLVAMDEQAGSTVERVRGAGGSMNGGVSWNGWARGSALNFDGNGDYVAFAGALDSYASNVGTFFVLLPVIRAWDTNGAMLWGTNTGNAAYFQMGGTFNTAWLFGAEITSVTNSQFLNSGAWAFVFSSDGTAAGKRFFANGRQMGTADANAPTALSAGAKTFRLGNWAGGDSWDLDGKIALAGFTAAVWGESEAARFTADPMAMLRPPLVVARRYASAAGLSPAGLLNNPRD